MFALIEIWACTDEVTSISVFRTREQALAEIVVRKKISEDAYPEYITPFLYAIAKVREL